MGLKDVAARLNNRQMAFGELTKVHRGLADLRYREKHHGVDLSSEIAACEERVRVLERVRRTGIPPAE